MNSKILVGGSLVVMLLVLAVFAIGSKTEPVSEIPMETALGTTTDNPKKTDMEVLSDEPATISTDAEADISPEVGRRALPSETPTETLVGSEKFSGVLQEVNTGCFADGECYVVVGGKHITTLIGWSNSIVGMVRGVEGFGDLEYFIGETVEVYAGKKSDGTYTLYQDADYYVALTSAAGASVELNKATTVGGLKITATKVLEDSRCPMGVMCIQAGTVKLEVMVEEDSKDEKVVFELGKTELIFGQKVTFLRVDPEKEVDVAVIDYSFYFGVQ